MVEQANNNTGSLVAYHNEMKQRFGTWMALAETRTRVKMNVIDQTEYRRNMYGAFEYPDWKEAHEWGKKYAHALSHNEDMTRILRPQNRPYHIGTKTFSRLTTKALDKRDEHGEPVYFKCAGCSTIGLYEDSEVTVNGAEFCDACRDNGAVRRSECMGGWIFRGDAVAVYHDAYAYENRDADWATYSWVESQGYRRRNSVWFSDEAFEAYNDENGGAIHGYHSGPDLAKIISPEWAKRKPLVLLGMELEVENIDGEGDEIVSNEDIAKSIFKVVGKQVKGYMKCENDGSLDNGFEIITAPTGLDTHAKALAQLRNAEHFDQIHSHSTDTCGLHVHVCKAGMTVLHAAKLQAFINSPKNEKLVRTIARRYQTGGSGYAKIEQHEDWIKNMGKLVGPDYRAQRKAKKDYGDNYPLQHRDYVSARYVHDRYMALNFRNDHTVEFRLFRGTLKFESIMACLEFAYACWFFTREASMKDLTTEAFMKFICRAENRKDTKHLRGYLKAKKFRAFYQAEQIARPKFKDEVPGERDERIMLDEEPDHIPLSMTRAEARSYPRIIA